jgi:hypothetical protein
VSLSIANFLREERGEVMRQEARSRRAVRSGCQFLEHPTKVGLRVHPDKAACSKHAIHHGGDPAGSRMRNEQHILQSQLGWAEAVLDPVVVDADMTVADLRIQRELPPMVIGVVDGFFEFSEECAALYFRFAQVPEYFLDAFQDWFGFEMAWYPRC